MISCSDAKNLINSYIDGFLNEADSTSFEEHISYCENCHHEYDLLKSMIGDLACSKSVMPADFARKMHIALVNNQLKDNSKKEESFFGNSYMKLATVTTAAIMIAVVGKFGVYDVYKDISNETIQTKTVVTEGNNNEVALSEVISDVTDNADVSTAPEKIQEKVKIVEVVKKEDDTDITETVYSTSNVKDDTPQITGTIEDTVLLQEPIPAVPVMGESPSPLALARVSPSPAEEIEFDVPDNATEIANGITPGTVEAVGVNTDVDAMAETEEISVEGMSETTVSASGGISATSESTINSTIETLETEETVEVEEIIQEVAPAENRFVPTESISPSPTIVEIYKSGEGNMPTIKNYLYTFLDGSEIAEANGQITVTIGADEYESVMKKISSNEYVKSITVGNTSEGKAIIIIK